jgi:N-acyl-L-homoserine lactone synthetase
VICCAFFLEANHPSMLTTVLSHHLMHSGGSKQKMQALRKIVQLQTNSA